MIKRINIPMCLTGGEKIDCYITSNKKVIDKLINTGDYITIYDEKIFKLGKKCIVVSNTIALNEAYAVLECIEAHLGIELPYKINNLLEAGAFDSEIKWA